MVPVLRFILATFVLISHLDIRIFGLNPGVIAVIVFYILAGHVIARLYLHKFSKHLLLFYFERGLRIYPFYFFVAFLTILFLVITEYGQPEFKVLNIFLNFLIIPLNYYMYIEEHLIILKGTEPPWWLIPPAWSLGAELQVYLLMPILLTLRIFLYIAFILSFLVYNLANLNILHSDYFGYRLIIGTLFIFIVGAILEKLNAKTANKFDIFLLISLYFFSMFWFIIVVGKLNIYGIYTRETLLGILIGVPLVLLSLKIRPIKSLNIFGNLSYGIFLTHFLSIWFLDFLGLLQNVSSIEKIIVVFLLSLFLAYIGVIIVDKPIEKIRYYLSSSLTHTSRRSLP